MDVDDLDTWLGEVDEGEEAMPLWSDPADDDVDPRGRWVRIAAAAAAVWIVLGVIAVAVLRDDPAVEAAAIPSVLPPDPAEAPVTATEAADDLTGAAQADVPTADPGPEPTATSTPDPEGSDWPGDDATRRRIEVAAVLAVREHLVAGGDPDVFVERSTAVSLQPLSPAVGAVTVDTVWLTRPDDGDELVARRTQHTVPVDVVGIPQAAPWVVAAPVLPTPAPVEPPAGEARVDEVRAAFEVAGWSQVVVAASAEHPAVPGIWQVVVDGVDPSGAVNTGRLVWLEDADGLAVLGVRS